MRPMMVAATLILSALNLWGGLAIAAEAPAAGPDSSLSEIEINARREKLSALRAEMVKLEDRFYAKYNELNTDDQYDVGCNTAAPTGSHLNVRECQPVFVDRATEAEAQSLLPGGHFTAPASMVITQKWPTFEKTMGAVIATSPELRKLIKEREALEKRYQAVRKQKFKGKIIVFD